MYQILLLAAFPNTLYVFNAKNAQLKLSLPVSTADSAGANLIQVSWSPDSQSLGIAYSDGLRSRADGLYVWNITSGKLVKTLPVRDTMAGFEWLPDGKFLAIATDREVSGNPLVSTLTLWDTTSWTMVKQYPNIAAFSWSPTGQQLALVDQVKSLPATGVRIVNPLTGQTVKQLAQGKAISDVQWSPDGTRIVTQVLTPPWLKRNTQVWSTSSGKLLFTFTTKWLYGNTWSPNSKYIASIASDDTPQQSIPGQNNNQPSQPQQHIMVWVAQ